MGYYQGEDYISDYDGPEIDNLLGKTVWQSNLNLLDNGYFVGGGSQQGGGQFPINQRNEYVVLPGTTYFDNTWAEVGVTEAYIKVDNIIPSGGAQITINDTQYLVAYPSDRVLPGYMIPASNTYIIDRWYSYNSGAVPGAVLLTDYGIRFVHSATADGMYFNQKIETARLPEGATVTGTMLLADGTIYSGTVTVPQQENQSERFFIDNAVGQLNIVRQNNTYWVYFYAYSSDAVVSAIKLELGDTQTLAHQDANGNWVLNEIPNFQQELAKCQRYYWKSDAVLSFGTYFLDGAYKNAVIFPVTMRTNPVVSAVSTNGIFNYFSTIHGFIFDTGATQGVIRNIVADANL